MWLFRDNIFADKFGTYTISIRIYLPGPFEGITRIVEMGTIPESLELWFPIPKMSLL